MYVVHCYCFYEFIILSVCLNSILMLYVVIYYTKKRHFSEKINQRPHLKDI